MFCFASVTFDVRFDHLMSKGLRRVDGPATADSGPNDSLVPATELSTCQVPHHHTTTTPIQLVFKEFTIWRSPEHVRKLGRAGGRQTEKEGG